MFSQSQAETTHLRPQRGHQDALEMLRFGTWKFLVIHINKICDYLFSHSTRTDAIASIVKERRKRLLFFFFSLRSHQFYTVKFTANAIIYFTVSRTKAAVKQLACRRSIVEDEGANSTPTSWNSSVIAEYPRLPTCCPEGRLSTLTLDKLFL